MEGELHVYRCTNGHVHFSHDLDGETNLTATCWSCNSTTLTEITDPQELMALAERDGRKNRENGHKFADAALLARMRQLDPDFATKYDKIMADLGGFWYA